MSNFWTRSRFRLEREILLLSQKSLKFFQKFFPCSWLLTRVIKNWWRWLEEKIFILKDSRVIGKKSISGNLVLRNQKYFRSFKLIWQKFLVCWSRHKSNNFIESDFVQKYCFWKKLLRGACCRCWYGASQKMRAVTVSTFSAWCTNRNKVTFFFLFFPLQMILAQIETNRCKLFKRDGFSQKKTHRCKLLKMNMIFVSECLSNGRNLCMNVCQMGGIFFVGECSSNGRNFLLLCLLCNWMSLHHVKSRLSNGEVSECLEKSKIGATKFSMPESESAWIGGEKNWIWRCLNFVVSELQGVWI